MYVMVAVLLCKRQAALEVAILVFEEPGEASRTRRSHDPDTVMVEADVLKTCRYSNCWRSSIPRDGAPDIHCQVCSFSVANEQVTTIRMA